MRVAVAGGTGVAGRASVTALEAAGHDPVVLARSTGVDLISGEGLNRALDGVDAVIDASNVNAIGARASIRFFETAAGNLGRCAREAGVRHIVGLSIVGIDRVPFGYYQGKLAHEQTLRACGLPVSILRATQFHEFARQLIDRMPGPVLVVPRMRSQPVAVAEVGRQLARLATGDPVPMTELAGPREEDMPALVRATLRHRGARKLVLPVRMPGAAGRAMADGGCLPQDPSGLRASQTFSDWLDAS